MSEFALDDPPTIELSDDELFAEWLERVRSTYEAVAYTCSHRLTDPGLAGQVAVQVVAGLLSRPMVFRYFGLPYSGRIAVLAEGGIADADAGSLKRSGDWSALFSRLTALPPEHRDVLVSVCVRGQDVDELAQRLNCDTSSAATRRDATLAFMRELAALALPEASDSDEGD